MELMLRSFRRSSRRSREEIFDDFRLTLNQHASMTNPLNIERRGLIDYEQNNSFENELFPRDRITVNELQLKKEHRGRFILCRIVAGSYQLLSVFTLIEDPNGTVERLSLLNWSDAARVQAWNLATRRCIPIGTIIAIRNPSYMVGPDGYTLIRCDNPEDVQIIRSTNPLLEGISWDCPPIRSSRFTFPSKLNRFRLRSEQLVQTESNSGHPNLLCTPPRTRFLEQKAGSSHKCKKRRHEKREKRGNSFAMMVRRQSSKSFVWDSNAILIFCFVIFVWYVFML